MKALSAAVLLICASSVAGAVEPPRFVEESEAAGLRHAYEGGWEFFVGGGVAVLDCNDDGRQDLFIAGGSGPAGLFRNLSRVGGALRFEPLSVEPAGLTEVIGGYPLDIDGDDLQDLVVLRVGENLIYRGVGKCRFERANEAWAFAGGDAWSTAFAAHWEKDAVWPTFALGNYVDRNQPGSPFGTCHDNFLYRPKKDGEGFAPPVTLAPGRCALSAMFSDWNRSGEADLRLANDRQYYRGGEEQLWRTKAGKPPKLYSRRDGWRKLTIWGMGIAHHDLDADGYPEFFLTSMGDNKLQALAKGARRPSYRDATLKRGLTAHRPYAGDDILPSTAWHAEFRDVNNDGFIDLFVAKGNVEAMQDFAARDPNNLLIGRPDGNFVESGEAAGIVNFNRARGAALPDLNLDGLPDLVVVNRRENVELWRNVGAGEGDRPVPLGNWLHLSLRQEDANRHAVGAWVEVRIGTRTLSREITVGGGHAGGSAGWIHFGTGTAERARVRVQWPDGEWGPWIRLYTNQFARITRGNPHAEIWLPPRNDGGAG